MRFTLTRFFFINDDNNLIPLTSFEIHEGTTPTTRIATLSGDVFNRSRKQPDTFVMDATELSQRLGRFHVIDENCFVYECVGTKLSILPGRTGISGEIIARWQVEEKDRAEVMRRIHGASSA